MTERLSLDLDLVDKVSGPALRAAKALQSAQASGDKFANAWRGIGNAAASEASKAASAIAKQESATRRLGLAQLQAASMNKKFDAAKNKEHGHGFFSSFKDALPFRSIGDYMKGAFYGHLAAEGVEKIVEGFAEGAHKAVELLYEGVKKAFEEGAKSEQLRVSYGLLLGKKGGSEALEDISRFSGKTRFDDDKIAELMRPLFNSGLRGQGARSAFAAASDLDARFGGGVEGFVEQLSKIQLKGGVTDKLLVGMGVELKPFFADLAKSLHTDASTAKKRAEGGKLDPSILLNAVYAGIERKQGGKLGSGGEAMSKTLGARLEKVQNLPNEYLKQMSKSPAWDRLSEKLGEVLEGLSPEGERGQRIIASLFKVFDKITDWLSDHLNEESFDAFTAGASKAIEFLTEIPDILNTALKAAEAFAAIWLGVKIVSGISSVVTGLTAVAGVVAGTGPAVVATTAAVATMAATLLAAAAAAGALYVAFNQINDTAKELGGWKSVGQDLMDYGVPAAEASENPDFKAYQEQNARNVALAHAKSDTTIHMHGDINVQAEKDDPTHTGQKAGEAIHRGMVNALEQAAQEGG